MTDTTTATTALEVLRDALEATAYASMSCTRAALTDATEADLPRLVEVLADAEALAQSAFEVRDSARLAVLQLVPNYGTTEIPGVGVIERRSGSTRKNWDHDRVRSLVVTRTLERLTNDDGEIRNGPGAVAMAVADALAETGAVAYWRVGALKEWGINADALCTKESGPDRLTFTPIGGGDRG